MPLSREELLLLVQLVPIAMFCIVLLAALGAPLLCVVSEQLAVTKKRVFYDKFGLQLANMSLRLSVIGILIAAGATAFYYTKVPDFYPPAAMPLFMACGGALLLFLAQVVLYNVSWKPLKQMKGPHKALGLTAQVVAFVLIVLVLATKRYVLATMFRVPELAPVELFRTALALPGASALWPLAVQTFVLALASAGCVGLVYLLLRRNLEDYGRDYYNFSLRYCARGAMVASLAHVVCFGWTMYALLPHMGGTGAQSPQNPMTLLAGAAAVLWLLATLVFLIVGRSQTPLRLKGTIVVGFVLTGAGLACMGMLLYMLLPTFPAFMS